MRAKGMTVLLFTLHIASTGCSADPEKASKARELTQATAKLKLLHAEMGEPQPGDWLASHDEPGQTFFAYLKSEPVTPTGKRSVIYVQPLGSFSEKQREIVELSANFLGRYYNRTVKIRKDLPLSVIPEEARRVHPSWGMQQILSSYVLEHVLYPQLPADGAASIALTTSDLWPGEGWNFVFGQASLKQRVGVWSLYRNGDPEKSDEAFRLCLSRAIKTATHETGHMFSMGHCTAYECNMCGSNSRDESDRRPLYLCPECVAKACWATDADIVERYRSLAQFCKEHGLTKARKVYEKSIAMLTE